MPYSIFYSGNFAIHGTVYVDRLGLRYDGLRQSNLWVRNHLWLVYSPCSALNQNYTRDEEQDPQIEQKHPIGVIEDIRSR